MPRTCPTARLSSMQMIRVEKSLDHLYFPLHQRERASRPCRRRAPVTSIRRRSSSMRPGKSCGSVYPRSTVPPPRKVKIEDCRTRRPIERPMIVRMWSPSSMTRTWARRAMMVCHRKKMKVSRPCPRRRRRRPSRRSARSPRQRRRTRTTRLHCPGASSRARRVDPSSGPSAATRRRRSVPPEETRRTTTIMSRE